MGIEISTPKPPYTPTPTPNPSPDPTPIPEGIPSSSNTTPGKMKYAQLKADLLAKKELFSDPDFPATYRILSDEFKYDRNVKWLRPSEIITTGNPKFMIDGATRSDLNQAALGDCWFISGAVCLVTYNSALFNRVVPKDQSFIKDDYAGIFYFHFWEYGKFVEVVIDDLLPTKYGQLLYAGNKTQSREFWPSLLEKAYAKFYGGYKQIDGGFLGDACVDMTGGISEHITFAQSSRLSELYDILKSTASMNSMMGLSIQGSGVEQKLASGLYKAHAYGVTGFATVNYFGKDVDLVRIRNPWGKGEWNGTWSDGSREWIFVSQEEKERLGLLPKDDGEFWMSFDDVISNFEDLDMCHLYPDAQTSEAALDTKRKEWHVLKFHGEWVPGLSAGGCGNPPYQDLYWSNPQYKVTLKEKTVVIVSLLIKGASRGFNISTCYHILKIKEGASRLPEGKPDYMSVNTLMYQRVGPDTYSNFREHTGRYVMEAGSYIVIPSTFSINQAAEFMLRIYTEIGEPVGGEIDDETIPVQPEPISTTADILFKKYAGQDEKMYAHELQLAIDELFEKYGVTETIGYERARCLLSLRDKYHLGYILQYDFKKIVEKIKDWQLIFASSDKDKSGKLNTYELSTCLKEAGFQVSRLVQSSIVKRYGGREFNVNLHDFVLMISKLTIYNDLHQEYSKSDSFKMSLDQWLSITMCY